MAAKLEKLVNLRSQLREAVLNYLTQLANRLDQTDWWRGSERIKASEIAVEPFVFTMCKRERPVRSESYHEEREAYVERRSPMDEIEAERYELPVKVEEREEERWRQVIRRGRVRIGLKGAPGSGKTFTTRQTIVALAREAAAQLERRQLGVEEVETPVWVTAKNLAQTGAREIEEALIEAMENGLQLKLSPNLRAWLKREIVSSRAFIVVDALDELLESDRAPFDAKAKQLDGLSARVIATCRTMQWEERRDWLGWGSLTEVELAPFKRRQQREFTGRFFERQPDLRQNMERLLQSNYALRHACTAPLLLTFACLLHEEGKVNESTSYTGLYAQMGRLMFSGRWRGVKPDWMSSRVREESCWRFLEGIAWRLFSKSPHLNRFTLDDWRLAAGQTTESGAVAPMDATVFLEELEQIGMIAPAGFDEQRADLCWSFAHRTFLEFLAARALSRMDRQVWLVEAKQHFWFEPEWLEVLTFLAGMVDDATSLIEAVEEERERDDIFGSMLYLKARMAGASSNLDEQLTQQVSNEVVSYWYKHDDVEDGLREFALPKITAITMNRDARSFLVESMLASARDALRYDSEGYLVEHDVGEILGYIGDEEAVEQLSVWAGNDTEEAMKSLGLIGGEKAVEALLNSLQKVLQKRRVVSFAALESLSQLEPEQAVKILLELTWDWEEVVRHQAAEMLGQIGDDQAIERLLELMIEDSELVRTSAEKALIQIGGEQLVERLLALTWECESFVHKVRGEGSSYLVSYLASRMRHSVVTVVGEIGDGRAFERLLALTQDSDERVCRAAAKGLGRIGDKRAMKRLLELTWDVDTCEAATEALGRIGGEEAVERLLALTWDKWEGTRLTAVKALGCAGDSRAVERLLAITADADGGEICLEAIFALGKIGGQRAVERLLTLTRDRDWGVRDAAVWGLMRNGGQKATVVLVQLLQDEVLEVPEEPEVELYEEPEVGERAAAALGKIGDERAVEPLLSLLRLARREEEYWFMVKTVVYSLWQISWRHRIPITEPISFQSKS